MKIEDFANRKGFGLKLETIFLEVSGPYNVRFKELHARIQSDMPVIQERFLERFGNGEDGGLRSDYLEYLSQSFPDILGELNRPGQLVGLFQLARLYEEQNQTVFSMYQYAQSLIHTACAKRGFPEIHVEY